MAFRKKFQKAIALQPDILVVIECEGEISLRKALEDYPVRAIFWYGDHPHKGIAIVMFIEARLQLFENYNPEFRYVLPFRLSTNNQIISLFVIWAMPNKTNRKAGYVGQIWKAVHHYKSSLKNPCILLGDFNSNAIWDKERREGNHSQLVDYLSSFNIHSLYHQQSEELHGKESKATWFMYRHEDKPYHLDYCFLSDSLKQENTHIEIGNYEEWIPFSDHMPLIISDINV